MTADFVTGQHHGQAGGPLGTNDVVEPGQLLREHLAVEEEQRTERLVLGGTGDMALDGQRRQEPRHLESTHLERVPLAMEEDVPADPRDVGFLGAAAIVPGADGLADAVEESRLRCAAGPISRTTSAEKTPSGDAGYEIR